MSQSTAFFTGDRNLAPFMYGFVAVELLRAVSAGEKITVGDSERGAEAVVRQLCNEAGVQYEVVETPSDTRDFDAALDKRHAQLKDDGARIVVFHAQPHTSHYVHSLTRVFEDSEGSNDFQLVTPATALI